MGALERWIVTDSRWKMNDLSRLSLEASLMLWLRSSKKRTAESFIIIISILVLVLKLPYHTLAR